MKLLILLCAIFFSCAPTIRYEIVERRYGRLTTIRPEGEVLQADTVGNVIHLKIKEKVPVEGSR